MADSIKQIRNSIDGKLDALQAQAEAFSVQFGLSKEQRAKRLTERKREMREALDRLRVEIRHLQGLAAGRKEKLAGAIDDLRVQIALGRMDAGDTLEAERKKTSAAIHEFEHRIDRLLAEGDAAVDAMIHKYVRARDGLLAELSAAAVRMKEEAACGSEILSRRRKELTANIDKLQQQVGKLRKRIRDKLKRFEEDLQPGVEQIGHAFKKLFSQGA